MRIALGSVLKAGRLRGSQAYEVRPNEKMEMLRQLLYGQEGQPLVFARTKRGTERLAKQLARAGFSAAMLHGDGSQCSGTAH